ncbi:DUF1214 domain-containing protein [Altererythrobacter salegens]|uniref:DUF1214 domain-containing protein n=1 Tax=Croceibacterium salegens TaxID=1737568 RepID=A0A6I4SV83_9SPHN|nr:DUF1214 domain-containing protein [Croceibacterium salegens]MXO59935.1 DUF1214 domain-containing protein [Croceibacterium salegens]
MAKQLENAALIGDEVVETPYGPVTIEHNFTTDDSIDMLYDILDFQRACQAYIWATPAVSFKQWGVAQAEAFDARNLGDFVVYTSLNEKRGILTANLTTPYVINFCSLQDGPVIVQTPKAEMAGMLMDLWQRPLADIGQTGPDQGQGGTYIVIGPDHDEADYQGMADFTLKSETNNFFTGIRILNPSPEVVDTIKRDFKVGHAGGELQPIRVIQGVDPEWAATAPRGLGFWKLLSDLYQEEPTREQDKGLAAMVEPLGIAKGKPFDPDARQQRILKQGAALGELMLRNMQINPRFAEPYWPGTSWYKSFDFTVPQITAEKIELDERGIWFYEAVTSSQGMVNPVVGKGQVYMTTKRDSDGALLRADKSYKLHVPAGVPVGQFWSLTLYSEATRLPYNNGGTDIPSASLDSRMDQLKYNDDGSVDLYIGASAPEGFESNHMKTVGTDGWFVYFRLYAPLEAFFDKSFTIGDFEKID